METKNVLHISFFVIIIWMATGNVILLAQYT